jgi:hypothetical protein
LEAYRTYGLEVYFEQAFDTFSKIGLNQVTETNAAYGSHDNTAFKSDCGGREYIPASSVQTIIAKHYFKR